MKTSRVMIPALLAAALIGGTMTSDAFAGPHHRGQGNGYGPCYGYGDGGCWEGGWGHHGHARGWGYRAMSDAQRAKFDKIMEEFAPRMEQLRDSIYVKRQELRALENATNPDVKAVREAATEMTRLRNEMADLHDALGDKLAAEVGVLLAGLALVTGMIWARRSWGVWWTWDPRLTTTLVMWFIYAGFMAVRSMPMPESRRAALSSVVAIAGFLDVPLVFLSARLWRSIHPAVFASEGGGLEPEMAVAVIACVVSFGAVWLAMLLLRYRQMLLGRRLDVLMFERMMAEDEKEQH